MAALLKNKKILALIPARGGSKGIPRKNIVDLAGYPLIAYSIALAKQSEYINRIVVTTDDKEIAGISRKYGAEVPFLRPKKFSVDKSADKDFFWHALRWFRKHENYCPDLIVHLRPTTPLREARVIDQAIGKIINDRKASSLRSAEVFDCESPYKMFKKEGAYWGFFSKEDFRKNEEYYNYPRQMLPLIYHPNGYVDIIRPEVLLKSGLLHGRYIKAFITDKTADIDNLSDLKVAARLLSDRKYKPLISMLKGLRRGAYNE